MRLSSFLRIGLVGALLAAPAAGLAAEGEPSIFAGGPGNAIITLIIFVVVITVLGKFAWQPILNVLNERERTIRESLESAKHEREEAEKLLAEYRAQLDKARDEAAAVVEQGRQDADKARQRILDEARQETGEMTARARREIELATDAAVKDLYDRTADLAIGVAQRVIEKELSPADHEKLIRDSIDEISKRGQARLN